MKHPFLILITFICINTIVHAQSSFSKIDSSHYIILANCANLDSLSKVFFNKGDEQFLIIDAYRDGLTKDESYHMVYENDKLTLNGHALPRQYTDKLHAMMKKVCEKPSELRFIMGPGTPENALTYVDGPRNNTDRKVRILTIPNTH